MSSLKVFVCGVTGNQGSATAAALLSRGAIVHALARDPSNAKYQAAAAKGIKLFPGSYEDEKSLASALNSCDAAFVNLGMSFPDPAGELKQGSAVLDAAKAAGVKHIVYSSGMGCEAPEKMEGYDPKSFMAGMVRSKRAIEELVRSGFPTWTILRLGHFNLNYLNPRSPQFSGLYEKGEWWSAATKDTRMAMIDTVTIGAFAAAAIYDPSHFNKQEIALGEELLTLDEIMAKLSRVTGRQLRVHYFTEEEVQAQLKVNPFLVAQVNMRNMSDFADLDKLKSYKVPLSTFDAYLNREQDAIKNAYKL